MTNVLPLNEMFETIQGEGSNTGRPSVFVRLQGCPVGCPWCDTKHTWHVLPEDLRDEGDILFKQESSATYTNIDAQALADRVATFQAKHVVITGGEPALYDLRPLTDALFRHNCTVQLETSGTHEISIHARAWVTVSPKIDMPGGFAVRDDALARANEIKMPVGKMDDIEALHTLLGRKQHRTSALIYLQPLSLSRKATELCVANAISNNWRVSIQVHAALGWR